MALRSGKKPAQWISDAEKCRIKWPYTPSDHIPSDELHTEWVVTHGGWPASPVSSRDLAYCTQACLLGLVRGQSLDLGCPNTARHRRGTATTKHLLTQEDVSRLTRKQLARSLDEGLHLSGSMGHVRGHRRAFQDHFDRVWLHVCRQRCAVGGRIPAGA
ncbi:hypothetical protein VTO42DRAFT_4270 [Malbranchea cinnamomea]